MGKKKPINDLDSMRKLALGGALTVKSASLLSQTGHPNQMWDTAGDMFGIGVAGATSGIAMDMITGKRKCHICKKRKPMKGWSICKQCKGEYGYRKPLYKT